MFVNMFNMGFTSLENQHNLQDSQPHKKKIEKKKIWTTIWLHMSACYLKKDHKSSF